MVKIPKNLSREAKQIWKKITEDYTIDDEAGLVILRTSLEAFDRMRDAQEGIAKEGLTILDRFKQKKVNPLTNIERDSRAAFLSGLQQLHLDLEPLITNKGGRPAGR